MFGCKSSRWEGDEYKTLSPLRADTHTGSFAIRKDGRWYDFATGEGGDFIDLVGRAMDCLPLEAAKHIVHEAGYYEASEAAQVHQSQAKPRAKLPIPVAADEGIRAAFDNELTRRGYGRFVSAWPYRQSDHQTLFYVCRYEGQNASKCVIPWYFGDDSAWHPGQPVPAGRPLFQLPELLVTDSPVLVVEGEKCATVPVPEGFPFFITTWSGGCRAVSKTDWTPILNREVVIWPDADEPGREAALAIRAQLPQAKVLRIEGRPLGWDIADAVSESIDLERFIKNCPFEKDAVADRGFSSPRLITQRASEITTRPVDWLWENRIPLGEYSVLVGHPSSGKSTFAAALAAHVSAGIPFPDGTEPAVGDVLFLSAEESASKALVPRLRVAGATLERVSIADIRLKHTDRAELFTLADGTSPIEAALDEMNSPRLIIIDSLTSCTAGIDTFRTDAFGPVLADLAQLSERRNVTTLCLAHFTKAVTNGAMLRVLGSVAVVALARAVYMLARHPDDSKRSLFVPVKNSYAPLGEAIEFSLVSAESGRLPQIRWGGQVEGVEADSLIALEDVDRRRERSDAMELLTEILGNSEEVLAHEIYTLGAERGLSKTTIWRAARDRKIQIEGKGRAAKWRLPIVSDSFHLRTYAEETITDTGETKTREVEECSL
ncbi:MAG: AAA family ATPase [Spirochaetia bacterium]|jgi:putative DNA primase/helicase